MKNCGKTRHWEEITVRFGSKWDCGNLMRLVKINRELTVGERQGGDLGSPRGREAGLHQETGQREPNGVAMSSALTQHCIFLFQPCKIAKST